VGFRAEGRKGGGRRSSKEIPRLRGFVRRGSLQGWPTHWSPMMWTRPQRPTGRRWRRNTPRWRWLSLHRRSTLAPPLTLVSQEVYKAINGLKAGTKACGRGGMCFGASP
jgi:hypothetical protein